MFRLPVLKDVVGKIKTVTVVGLYVTGAQKNRKNRETWTRAGLDEAALFTDAPSWAVQ